MLQSIAAGVFRSSVLSSKKKYASIASSDFSIFVVSASTRKVDMHVFPIPGEPRMRKSWESFAAAQAENSLRSKIQ